MSFSTRRTAKSGRRRQWVLAVPLALAALWLVAAGCSSTTHSGAATSATSAGVYGTSATATTSPPASSPTPANPASAPAVTVGHTPLGSIVTDGAGMTVYLFEKDTGTTSSCYGACATAWPPVLATSTQPGAGNGADQAMVATTMRTDGKTQLTYAGHPLYHFAGDHKPGDTTGQGSHAFGAGWYVITPAGQKIDSGD